MVMIPINANVLRWAINEARISPEVLTERCHFAPGTIDNWMAGVSAPNTGQLRTISSRLGRSFQFFLLPEPPTTVAVDARFRGSRHENTPEPEKESAALRAARRAQTLVRWVEDGSLTSPRILPRDANEAAAAYAGRLGAHLQWALPEQKRASSKSAVFKLLRKRAEDLGIVVMMQSAGKKSFRGFSLDKLPAVIFINKDYGGGALRSFTLLHELAHLGAGTAGRTCYYDDTDEERWCNKVATEFLLPQEAFAKYVGDRHDGLVTANDTDIIRLASNYFKASWLAIAIRLTEVGRADQNLIDHIRDNAILEKDPSTPVPGIDRTTPVLRSEEFGSAYIRTVQRAVRESRLSELEASKLLRVNAKQLNSLWQASTEAR
ncbi:ImmA/IrrE family metallo-endopeptidase [Cryobacterium sp. PH31-L1]|uniref:ImmA/IrrE family metallo-endopeptidase n=1 Tax=Cryobacterium sp. PH31-L1 TaxID=3046199 RepID=UPI0024BBC887|nr:ImmA/IrrE family metallo-endopeptidase [Cryobacterium sp. PH31-L1]MDJ0379080.1 ImmA/IrrE family metallo-endopeptidase [Cryobacterium sp. PH31-L1]